MLIYISENFDFILNFVNDECEIDDTIALNKLKNLFQISDIKTYLKTLKFLIKINCIAI